MLNNIYKMSELLGKADEEPNEVIEEGILNENGLLLISGQPKSRKSFLVYNMAITIAAGKSFACFKIPKPKKALMISCEGGIGSNNKRLNKMCDNFGLDEKSKSAMADNLTISFVPKVWLNINEDWQDINETIENDKPEVLILDPLIRFHNVNENAANEMGIIFSRMRSIIANFNLSIILVHHHGKDDSGGARGSSTIQGEYDSSIQISRAKQKTKHTLKFDLRHSELPDDVILHFDADTFWFKDERHFIEDEFLQILRERKELSKSEWVNIATDKKILGHSTAYTRIDKYLKKDIIKLVDNKYVLN